MEHCNGSEFEENAADWLGANGPGGDEHAAPSARTTSRWPIMLGAAVIVLAAAAAYSNSLRCPFVFDDTIDIVSSTSIRHLWPIWDVFFVRVDGRTSLHGRPVAKLSLALDYATGGLDPLPYHLTNLLVHALAGLTLFGIVRRTLLLPGLRVRFATAATGLGLAVALLWTLHPLQTAAVTCVVQRYESMMGLFSLVALYAAIRCGTSKRPGGWAVASVAATLLALGCKEVAVSVPLLILLYDRAFLAGSFHMAADGTRSVPATLPREEGSFREAWRRRWGMYLGFAAAWGAFAVLYACSCSRTDWAGYGLPISWLEYAATQFGVILHYLRLSFWPHPLVINYGWPVARTAGQILPGLLVVGGLAAATAWALVWRPKWGFLGAWFFLILAPTSSVMPLFDLIAEQRMYLPLAAVVTTVVLGGWLTGQRLAARRRISLRTLQAMGAILATLAAIALGVRTFERNMDYRSELSLWQATVANVPDNTRAHVLLGEALVESGRTEEAMLEYEKALATKPDDAKAHTQYGAALASCGRADEGLAHCERALAISPKYVEGHNNLGVVLAGCGRVDEAVACYEKALEIEPNFAAAHNNLAAILAHRGQLDEAVAHYRRALELDPRNAKFHNNLAIALARQERLDEAAVESRRALEIKPGYAEAHNNLGLVLAERGDADEAIAQFRRAIEMKPDYAEAHNNMGLALMDRGQLDEAIQHYRKALASKPQFAEAQQNLDAAEALRRRTKLDGDSNKHEEQPP